MKYLNTGGMKRLNNENNRKQHNHRPAQLSGGGDAIIETNWRALLGEMRRQPEHAIIAALIKMGKSTRPRLTCGPNINGARARLLYERGRH